MFTELMPLLAERTMLITVARESDTVIRTTVIPKRIIENENAALSTPLSFVGAPEELDRDFGRALAEYVDAHQRLGSSLAQAKAEMEAAAKAAQEEAKRKADEKRKAKSPTSASAPAPAPASGDPVTGTTSSLFGEMSTGPVESQPAGQQQGGLRLRPSPQRRVYSRFAESSCPILIRDSRPKKSRPLTRSSIRNWPPPPLTAPKQSVTS
jgi:PRTRC genetic system protein E